MKFTFHFTDGKRNIYLTDCDLMDLLEHVENGDVAIVTKIDAINNIQELVNFKYVIRIEEFIEIPDMD